LLGSRKYSEVFPGTGVIASRCAAVPAPLFGDGKISEFVGMRALTLEAVSRGMGKLTELPLRDGGILKASYDTDTRLT
jgi:hypothetical protein